MSRVGWERAEDWQEQERFEGEADLRGRIFFMRLLVVSIFGFLLTYVVFVQRTQGDELVALAVDNQFAVLRTNAPRGVIFDINGVPLAENNPSFEVTITPAFLPDDEAGRQAVFQRLSTLIGIPITNTIAQRAQFLEADPYQVGVTSQLAQLYNEPITPTLDEAGIINELPNSIAGTVETFSFAQFVPAVITSSLPITLARIVQQEAVFMPGVNVRPQPVRNYPTGEYTSKLIGFMGPIPDESYLDNGYARNDRVGLFGLESALEEELAGVKGERTIEVDATGRETRQIGQSVPPIAGRNLHLTIDMRLQIAATEVLSNYLQLRRDTPDNKTGRAVEAEQGAIVAINPKTGEILALVNLPTYDNNRFATEIPVEYFLQLDRNDYQPLFNSAIGGQYPPGSIFKIVTAAAGLQEGIVSPSRRLLAPGSIVIPNRYAPNDPGRSQRFVCWIWNQYDAEGNRGEHGSEDVYGAMAHSCDIYFYKISGGFNQDGESVDVLGIDRFHEYIDRFGFGNVQGLELPAEAPGNNPTKRWKQSVYGEQWSTGDDYNIGIGQGYITSTPLQAAQMMAIIANGGFLYRPTLVHHLTDAAGRIVVEDSNGLEVFVEPPVDGGLPTLFDAEGNQLDPAQVDVSITFDENGNYVRPPELIREVGINQEYIDVIAQGLRLVNQEGGTAGFLGWEEIFTYETPEGTITIETAGKTGSAEYCDNIAAPRGWCADDPGEIQPTHAWYTSYAPFDDPEIAVAAFMYNGGEGGEFAAPLARDVMDVYFQLKYGLIEIPVVPDPQSLR